MSHPAGNGQHIAERLLDERLHFRLIGQLRAVAGRRFVDRVDVQIRIQALLQIAFPEILLVHFAGNNQQCASIVLRVHGAGERVGGARA